MTNPAFHARPHGACAPGFKCKHLGAVRAVKNFIKFSHSKSGIDSVAVTNCGCTTSMASRPLWWCSALPPLSGIVWPKCARRCVQVLPWIPSRAPLIPLIAVPVRW